MPNITLPEPIESFFVAVNAHDNQAFLAAFATDGVVDDWGKIITGTAAIDTWSAVEFIGSQPRFTAEQTFSNGDQITVIGDWRSHHANGASRFDFDLAGGLITRMTISEG